MRCARRTGTTRAGTAVAGAASQSAGIPAPPSDRARPLSWRAGPPRSPVSPLLSPRFARSRSRRRRRRRCLQSRRRCSCRWCCRPQRRPPPRQYRTPQTAARAEEVEEAAAGESRPLRRRPPPPLLPLPPPPPPASVGGSSVTPDAAFCSLSSIWRDTRTGSRGSRSPKKSWSVISRRTNSPMVVAVAGVPSMKNWSSSPRYGWNHAQSSLKSYSPSRR
mmetsp:Transcript_6678/g.19395  ORF Transcript_6678/g.19395 Transcript_6678/m.19395 type:complete len:219 (-) Transcript_6678:484-1140(-)